MDFHTSCFLQYQIINGISIAEYEIKVNQNQFTSVNIMLNAWSVSQNNEPATIRQIADAIRSFITILVLSDPAAFG